MMRMCVRTATCVLLPGACLCVQDELTKNRCRSKSIDVWQRGVDTGVLRGLGWA